MADEQADEAAALESLYEDHGQALLGWARRALPDRHQAEDLVQEALARAWAKADRFDPARGSPRAWLFAIARNLLVDRWRATRARPRVVALDPLLDAGAGGPIEPVADVGSSGALERAVEAWQVAEALGRLAPHHRQVLVACYYQGLSIAEAADRLGIPGGTVKSRLHYGLRSLRLVLEEMGVVG